MARLNPPLPMIADERVAVDCRQACDACICPRLAPVRRSQQQIIAYRVGSKTGVQPIDVSAHVDWNQ